MKLYSNSTLSTIENVFGKGANVYIDSDITLSNTTNAVSILLEVYSSTNVLQGTVLNTTYNFTANTSRNLTTDINGGVALYFTTVNSGKYYAKLTISKTGEVNTEYEYEYFTVNPSISSNTLVEDTLDFMLNLLRTNLVDPRSTIRTNPNWITPEYPDYQTNVEYPFIVIWVTSESSEGYLGIASNQQLRTLRTTLMVVTKNHLMKEQIGDDIAELIRLSRDTFTSVNFFNHKIVSSRNLDPDESRIQRKEIELTFDYIAS